MLKLVNDRILESIADVLVASQQEAQRAGHDAVGPADFVIAIVGQPSVLSALQSHGRRVDIDAARGTLERSIPTGHGTPQRLRAARGEGELPVSDGLQAILEESSSRGLVPRATLLVSLLHRAVEADPEAAAALIRLNLASEDLETAIREAFG